MRWLDLAHKLQPPIQLQPPMTQRRSGAIEDEVDRRHRPRLGRLQDARERRFDSRQIIIKVAVVSRGRTAR